MSWLSAAFGEFLVTPWLFLAGAALMSVPIIIHLLNKRRFRTVDWAAMDFLLEAERKNRRRVRLENLLMLLLRCLAVLLIGLLLARPFLRPSFASRLFNTAQFERIVLLDDSLSMQVQIGGESALDHAKRDLTDLIRSLAGDQYEDTLTLMLTSQPGARVVNGVRITPDSLDELLDLVNSIEGSDRTAELNDAYFELEQVVRSEAKNINRVVYVITDMRQHDWEPKEGESENHPAKVLAGLSKLTAGCYLIDVGDDNVGNLAVTGIRPDDTLVAGLVSRFTVTVVNNGREDVRDVPVRLTVGESVPMTATIDQIPAGESATVPFSFTFVPPPTDDGEAAMQSVEVRAEVVPQQPELSDRLTPDSTTYYAARVAPGVPVLLVDGDPSATRERSETFYLRRALDPVGIVSGIAPEVVTETELETVPLEKYQVIFLCNLERISDRRIEALEQWVRGGGGLVMMLGDRIDEEFFNRTFYRDGAGLSPARLLAIQGDEYRREWVGFQVVDARHESLKGFAGQNNPILERVQVFRWWEAIPADAEGDVPVQVPAQYTNESHQPAIIEKGFDKGRVMLITTPADADWSNWCDDPSYIVAMHQLTRYMAGNIAGRGELRVGEPIRQPVDLTRYRIDATVELPGERRTSLKAAPQDEKPEDKAPSGGGAKEPAAQPSPSENVWQVEFEGTEKRGFYRLDLTRTDGGSEGLLFAANSDPKEGDLKRTNRDQLLGLFRDAPIKIIRGEEAVAQEEIGSQSEIWKYVLMGLVGLLLGEQVLGFLFGRKR